METILENNDFLVMPRLFLQIAEFGVWFIKNLLLKVTILSFHKVYLMKECRPCFNMNCCL